MKKFLSLIGVLTLALVCSFVFVGCNETEEEVVDEGAVYGVVFDVNGGEEVYEDQSVDDGGKISPVADPTRIGYNFVGWYRGETKWDFEEMKVTENIELVAHWEADEVSWTSTEGLELEFDKATKTFRVVEYTGSLDEVSIPAMHTLSEDEAYQVASIGENAFKDSTIKKVSLPPSLQQISKSAFENASKLEEVAFYGTPRLKQIGVSAFLNATSLKTFVLPSSLTKIDTLAFSNTALEALKFGKELTIINDYAFYNTTSLNEVSFEVGAKLFYIGISAFEGSSISAFTLPDSVTNISEAAFRNLGMDSFTIGSESGLVTIGKEALMGNNFNYLSFNDGLRQVGDCAFASNPNLEYIILPLSLRIVGDTIVNDCEKVHGIYFNGSFEELDKSNFEASWATNSGKPVYYYSYSDTDRGVAGYWRRVEGIPTAYTKYVNISIDLSSLDLEGRVVGLENYFYHNEWGSHKMNQLEVVDGIAQITIEKYAYPSFRLYIFSESEAIWDMNSALAYSEEVLPSKTSFLVSVDGTKLIVE